MLFIPVIDLASQFNLQNHRFLMNVHLDSSMQKHSSNSRKVKLIKFYLQVSVSFIFLIFSLHPASAQNWIAGAAYGTPVYKSGYYKSAASAVLAIRTPITIEKGPFIIGVGLYAGQTSGKNSNNKDFSSVEGWGALVISLKDPFVIPFSIHAGGGIVTT